MRGLGAIGSAAALGAVVVVLVAARVDASADRDGDGLPDAWEERGVTVAGKFVDLPAMGADPDRADVFLQIDWMADAAHDQRPDPEAIRRVVEAFARAPYAAPTGVRGIALHVDAGPESVMIPPDTPWGALSRARALPWRDDLGRFVDGVYDWGEFLAIKNAPDGFVASGRAPVFRYAIFAHFHDRDDPNGSGASGISRGIGGSDLLVTLGNFTNGVGSTREQAGTLMHELGHNLGLRHGGDDDTNFKPGYVSVMNYAFQMSGITRGGERGVLDYSRGTPVVVDDAFVTEPTLLDADGSATASVCVAPGAARSGSAAGVVADPGERERPFDDWARIRLRTGSIGSGPAKPGDARPAESCTVVGSWPCRGGATTAGRASPRRGSS